MCDIAVFSNGPKFTMRFAESVMYALSRVFFTTKCSLKRGVTVSLPCVGRYLIHDFSLHTKHKKEVIYGLGFPHVLSKQEVRGIMIDARVVSLVTHTHTHRSFARDTHNGQQQQQQQQLEKQKTHDVRGKTLFRVLLLLLRIGSFFVVVVSGFRRPDFSGPSSVSG